MLWAACDFDIFVEQVIFFSRFLSLSLVEDKLVDSACNLSPPVDMNALWLEMSI